MAMITNGMTLIKISAYWQTLVTGALLVFACSLEYVRNRLKASLNS
jgi:ribose/xylose/arabinose/galactoside ABC-type transport system permease subunit